MHSKKICTTDSKIRALSNIEDTWLENIIMVHHPICLQWNCNRERQATEKHKLDDIHPCRCVVKIMLHLRGLTFWTSTNTTTLLDFYSSREFTFLSCEVVLDCNVLKGSAPNRFFGGCWCWRGGGGMEKKTLASTWGWIEGIPMPGGLLLTCVIYKTLTVGTTIKRLM